MPRATLAILALVCAACPPAATLPAGCGKDTDCKGSRVCVQRACVEPPRPSPSPGGARKGEPPPKPDAGAQVAAVDGGADAGPIEVATAMSGDGGMVQLAPPPPVGPSPMFHVDNQHSGRSRYRAPAALPHEVMHVATGGVVYSAPAIGVDGVIVFGSHDKSIYAANADGTIRWRKPTQDLVWCSPAIGPGGVVYAGSDDDHLYALDLTDGSLRWQFTAGPCRTAIGSGPEAARCDVDGVTVANDGTVYFSADGLYALRPEGTLKWKFSPGPTHCHAAPAVGPDGTVYVGCHDDALYAIDPVTGLKKWEYRTSDDIDSSPAVAPDGTVYVGSDDHKVYAFSATGALKFAVTTGGAVRSSPAIGADGTVYVGSFDASVYAIRPNGIVAWTFRTADRILSSPVVDAAGLVIVGSEDDRLYALTPEGKLAWSVLLDGDVDATPALGSDGTIYIGTDDRALHALR